MQCICSSFAAVFRVSVFLFVAGAPSLCSSLYVESPLSPHVPSDIDLCFLFDDLLYRHTPYPGVTAFYRELQGGGNVGQLVALSARPHIVNDIMERGVFKKFQILQANHGLHTMPGFFCEKSVSRLPLSSLSSPPSVVKALGSEGVVGWFVCVGLVDAVRPRSAVSSSDSAVLWRLSSPVVSP